MRPVATAERTSPHFDLLFDLLFPAPLPWLSVLTVLLEAKMVNEVEPFDPFPSPTPTSRPVSFSFVAAASASCFILSWKALRVMPAFSAELDRPVTPR